MKKHVEVIKDSFVDFQGATHYFTIAAVSEAFPYNYELFTQEMYKDGLCPINIAKGVKIGIAICNPEDTFSEKVGIVKAISRAENSTEYAILTSNLGYINTKVVKALLEQEAEYLKNNPEKYITGYREKRERYEADKRMEMIGESLTPIEKTIIEELKSNPEFLDKINFYWEWLQKKNAKSHKKQK